jgi:hypothetical protein
MDPEKLQRLLDNAEFSDRSASARVLEDDPDLVSRVSPVAFVTASAGL